MANWLKEELEHAEEVLERVIAEASKRLETITAASIKQASEELNGNVNRIADEFAEQRKHTKSEVKELVDHAAKRLAGLMVLLFAFGCAWGFLYHRFF